MTVSSDAARPHQSYLRGVLLVAFGMFVSSTIGLGFRSIQEATAWQVLTFRSVGTVVFLGIVLAWRNGGRFHLLFRQLTPAAFGGGFGLMLASCGVIVAFEHTTVANALFLMATAPFIAAILGIALLSERVRPEAWIAIALGLLGVAIMVGDGLSRGNLWGNVAGLTAAIGLAVFAVALRQARNTDLLLLALVGGVMTFVVATTATIVSGSGILVPFKDLLIGLAMGAFQLGCALLLILAGSRSVPAAEIALLGLVEIILAPLWVWLLFGESVGQMTLVGGATALFAVFIDAFTGMRRSRQKRD